MLSLNEVRRKIHESVAVAVRRGFKIRAGGYGVTRRDGRWVAANAHEPWCCPLGAVMVATAADDMATGLMDQVTARALEISPLEAWAFTLGFDDRVSKMVSEDNPFYRLGKEFRKEYVR